MTSAANDVCVMYDVRHAPILLTLGDPSVRSYFNDDDPMVICLLLEVPVFGIGQQTR